MFLEVKDIDGRRCLINTSQITSVIETDDKSTLITLTYCDSVVTPTPYDRIIDVISSYKSCEIVANSRKER